MFRPNGDHILQIKHGIYHLDMWRAIHPKAILDKIGMPTVYKSTATRTDIFIKNLKNDNSLDNIHEPKYQSRHVKDSFYVTKLIHGTLTS